MTAIRLDGRKLAQKKQEELTHLVKTFFNDNGLLPQLVVVLIGNDSASHVYVNNKEKMAQAIGMASRVIRLDETVSQEVVLQTITQLNNDDTVHGILVQLPLPQHIDEQAVLTAIDAKKDVDGFHPYNVGQFVLGNDAPVACTPSGIMDLFSHYQIDLSGKLVVVIGRSNIVGKPMALLLQQADATVIMAHSKTSQLKELTKLADIVVVAIGRGHFIDETFIKEGAIVVDVGMNRDDNGRLIGDVHPNVLEKASFMTPVPGGVGPMTIITLMKQTLEQAKKQVENA